MKQFSVRKAVAFINKRDVFTLEDIPGIYHSKLRFVRKLIKKHIVKPAGDEYLKLRNITYQDMEVSKRPRVKKKELVTYNKNQHAIPESG